MRWPRGWSPAPRTRHAALAIRLAFGPSRRRDRAQPCGSLARNSPLWAKRSSNLCPSSALTTGISIGRFRRCEPHSAIALWPNRSAACVSVGPIAVMRGGETVGPCPGCGIEIPVPRHRRFDAGVTHLYPIDVGQIEQRRRRDGRKPCHCHGGHSVIVPLRRH